VATHEELVVKYVTTEQLWTEPDVYQIAQVLFPDGIVLEVLP